MKTLKRWVTNLKWLFNHPPVGNTEVPRNHPCEFCGSLGSGIVYIIDGALSFSICYYCYFKAFRKALAPPKVTQKKKAK